jgi:pyrroloquinoline-quinone synthase
MLNKTEFKERIAKAIDEKSILKHPFYQKWNEGKLSKEELAEYSKQYFHFVKHFPMFVSAVHSNCAEPAIRKMLLENLADEEGFKTNIPDHPSLWENFCSALDVKPEDLENTGINPGVASMVNGFYDFCKNEDYKTGLAALLSYEYQIPEVSRVKIDGLAKHYNISSPAAIEFFTVHEKADVHHSGDELNVLLNYCSSREEQDKVIDTVQKGVNLYWKMLDGLYVN